MKATKQNPVMALSVQCGRAIIPKGVIMLSIFIFHPKHGKFYLANISLRRGETWLENKYRYLTMINMEYVEQLTSLMQFLQLQLDNNAIVLN